MAIYVWWGIRLYRMDWKRSILMWSRLHETPNLLCNYILKYHTNTLFCSFLRLSYFYRKKNLNFLFLPECKTSDPKEPKLLFLWKTSQPILTAETRDLACKQSVKAFSKFQNKSTPFWRPINRKNFSNINSVMTSVFGKDNCNVLLRTNLNLYCSLHLIFNFVFYHYISTVLSGAKQSYLTFFFLTL